jgi:23S rRNA pseudouridine1911/1915/1917 synthase
LEKRVRGFLQGRELDAADGIYLGVPHRLDRPASGVIVMTQNIRATRRMSKQFSGRRVQKTYWVLVEGQVQCDEGQWQDWMRKVPEEPRAELLAPDHPAAKLAITRFRVLRRQADVVWLELRAETGRMHQIRLQCAARGHPVLGDAQYGSRREFGPHTDDWRQRAIALHAQRLVFWHPETQEPLDVAAPPPTSWCPFMT